MTRTVITEVHPDIVQRNSKIAACTNIVEIGAAALGAYLIHKPLAGAARSAPACFDKVPIGMTTELFQY